MDSELHGLLLRQLHRAGIGVDQLPDESAWRAFLAGVSEAYRSAEDERLALEHSLESAATEADALARRLSAERDRLWRELDLARVLQTALLPGNTKNSHFEIAARTVTATEAGGDYYEIVPVRDGYWIGIGDVTGHGLRSAIIMMMVQSMVATLVRALPDAQPSNVLAMVNASLWDGIRNRLRLDDHVTCTLLRCMSDGRVRYAGAHEDIIVSRAGQRCERIETEGTWLGIAPDVCELNTDRELVLARGDLMVLFTDGAIESRDAAGNEIGLERLIAKVDELRDRPLPELCELLVDQAVGWTASLEDDVTVVAVRCV